ncbi:hypothetical protein EG329_011746 [Mollisiaceae sp. DMI_Dod_QoI]|nr:hypothetical protein EG329_011746 [Helotiales sp. DMI_Dod_QoI]
MSNQEPPDNDVLHQIEELGKCISDLEIVITKLSVKVVAGAVAADFEAQRLEHERAIKIQHESEDKLRSIDRRIFGLPDVSQENSKEAKERIEADLRWHKDTLAGKHHNLMVKKFNLLLHLQDGSKSAHKQLHCLCGVTALEKNNEGTGTAKNDIVAKENERLQREVTRLRNELTLLAKTSHEKTKAQWVKISQELREEQAKHSSTKEQLAIALTDNTALEMELKFKKPLFEVGKAVRLGFFVKAKLGNAGTGENLPILLSTANRNILELRDIALGRGIIEADRSLFELNILGSKADESHFKALYGVSVPHYLEVPQMAYIVNWKASLVACLGRKLHTNDKTSYEEFDDLFDRCWNVFDKLLAVSYRRRSDFVKALAKDRDFHGCLKKMHSIYAREIRADKARMTK